MAQPQTTTATAGKILLKNFAEHAFEFPKGPRRKNTIVIPRATLPAGDSKAGLVPGEVEVTEEDLALMMAHPIIADSWFGREGLQAPADAMAKARAGAASAREKFDREQSATTGKMLLGAKVE